MTSSVTTYDPLMNLVCGAAGAALLAKGVSDMNDPRANAKVALLETVAGTVAALYAGNKYLQAPTSPGVGIDWEKKFHVCNQQVDVGAHFLTSPSAFASAVYDFLAGGAKVAIPFYAITKLVSKFSP